MKHDPMVGEHLYIYIPCNDYWVSSARQPYTVESVKQNTIIIRRAKAVFLGPQYYDSLPDYIVDDVDGDRLVFRWSEKKHRWQESPAGSYPRVAVFGEWDYQPYLN